MGMMQRRKGAAGEREAAEKLNEVLGTKFHRGRQYHGGSESPDLAGDLPGLHLEVKRVEALRLYPSLEQARRDAPTDAVPAVMHRMNKKPWVVIVYADDLIRLLDVIDACRGRSEVRDDAHGSFHGVDTPPREYALKSPSAPCPAPAPLLEGGLTAGKDALCATRTKLSPLIPPSPPKGKTPPIPLPQAAAPLPPRGGGGPDPAGGEQGKCASADAHSCGS